MAGIQIVRHQSSDLGRVRSNGRAVGEGGFIGESTDT